MRTCTQNVKGRVQCRRGNRNVAGHFVFSSQWGNSTAHSSLIRQYGRWKLEYKLNVLGCFLESPQPEHLIVRTDGWQLVWTATSLLQEAMPFSSASRRWKGRWANTGKFILEGRIWEIVTWIRNLPFPLFYLCASGLSALVTDQQAQGWPSQVCQCHQLAEGTAADFWRLHNLWAGEVCPLIPLDQIMLNLSLAVEIVVKTVAKQYH